MCPFICWKPIPFIDPYNPSRGCTIREYIFWTLNTPFFHKRNRHLASLILLALLVAALVTLASMGQSPNPRRLVGETSSHRNNHMPRTIFVFGSNTQGRHGKGAALEARLKHGAIYGQSRGLQGNSYAIPTKDLHKGLRSVPLEQIKQDVYCLLYLARCDDLLAACIFQVTRIGCGLAGYHDHEIGPLFKGAPSNVILPPQWEQYR